VLDMSHTYKTDLLYLTVKKTNKNSFNFYLRYKLNEDNSSAKTKAEVLSGFLEIERFNVDEDNLLQWIVEGLKDIEQKLLDNILLFDSNKLFDSSYSNRVNEKINCLYGFVEMNKIIDNPKDIRDFLAIAKLIKAC